MNGLSNMNVHANTNVAVCVDSSMASNVDSSVDSSMILSVDASVDLTVDSSVDSSVNRPQVTSDQEMIVEHKKFVILFDGHEGSSALISYLSMFPGTSSPLSVFGFEPFEPCNYGNYQEEDFSQLISYLLENNHSDFLTKYHSMKPLHDQLPLPVGNYFFKMRESFATPKIINMFKKYDVTIFLLYRRDFLKHSLSLMDPQLQFVGSTVEEKSIYDPEIFSGLCHYVKQVKTRKDHLFTFLKSLNIRVQKIYYEDMLVDVDKYVKDILTFANIPFDFNAKVQECWFKKVHPDDVENFVSNYSEIITVYKSIIDLDESSLPETILSDTDIEKIESVVN
jgi:hypothetical protein